MQSLRLEKLELQALSAPLKFLHFLVRIFALSVIWLGACQLLLRTSLKSSLKSQKFSNLNKLDLGMEMETEMQRGV